MCPYLITKPPKTKRYHAARPRVRLGSLVCPAIPAGAGVMGYPKPPDKETRPARRLALPVALALAQEFHGILVQDEVPRLRVAPPVLG